MECPHCNELTSVLETRHRRKDGSVVRRRVCPNHHKFSTTELVLEEARLLRALSAKLKQLTKDTK